MQCTACFVRQDMIENNIISDHFTVEELKKLKITLDIFLIIVKIVVIVIK